MANSALTAKLRLQLFKRVFIEGVPVAKACREFGISRFTFYKWARNYDPNASRNQNIKNLQDKKRKIKRFAGQTPTEIEEKVKRLVSEHPRWSKYRIAEELEKRLGKKTLGVHGAYNVLKRAGLTTRDRREAWSKFVRQDGKGEKRILTPEQRLKVIERAVKLGVPVAQVCRDFSISRFTFYKWKKHWEEGGKTLDALQDKSHLLTEGT